MQERTLSKTMISTLIFLLILIPQKENKEATTIRLVAERAFSFSKKFEDESRFPFEERNGKSAFEGSCPNQGCGKEA